MHDSLVNVLSYKATLSYLTIFSVPPLFSVGFLEYGHTIKSDAAEFLLQTQSAVVRTRSRRDSLLIPTDGLSGPVEQERGLNPVIRSSHYSAD